MKMMKTILIAMIKILPAVSVSFKDNEMSLFSDLFGIRTEAVEKYGALKADCLPSGGF